MHKAGLTESIADSFLVYSLITIVREGNKLLVHSLTTTNESKVHEYLSKISENSKKAFVLTSRLPDDETHIRYDVFMFVKDEEPASANRTFRRLH